MLADLELDLRGVETEFMYPRKLTDLFRGMQMVLIGRYTNSNDLQNSTIVLRGMTGERSRSFTFSDLDFPLRSEENTFLPRLWASRRVGWLIEQIRLNGETKELKDEVVDLGTRFGIVTPYTSYLATDGTLANAPRDSNQFSALQRAAPAKMRAESGAGAVRQSVQQNTMQANVSVTADGAANEEDRILIANTNTNQFLGSKNFFNQGNVWTDSEYNSDNKMPEVRLRFASDEYFAVLSKEKELAQYFSLGEEVVVVWKGKVYRVTN